MAEEEKQSIREQIKALEAQITPRMILDWLSGRENPVQGIYTRIVGMEKQLAD
jgi:hypothetical protein